MSRVTEAAVLNALRPIQDPDFKKSIVDLGFIKDLRIEGPHVAFSVELTTPACPVKERFQEEARAAVMERYRLYEDLAARDGSRFQQADPGR